MTITPRSGGDVSGVYEAEFADGADSAIVKAYAEVSRRNRAKELHVYELLRRHGAGPIPTILHSAESPPHLDGRAYTVMTMLPGEPLPGVTADMTAPERYEICRQPGSLEATVHQIGMDGFGSITTEILNGRSGNVEYLTRQFDRKPDEHATYGGDGVLRDAICQYVAERTELFAACESAVLCHNDFHEGNVLVTRDKDERWQITGFIDVGNAIAADPLMDVVKTDWYSIRGDMAKFNGLVDGYGGESALGPSWAERIEAYRPHHMLELWNWFSEIGTLGPLDSITGDMRALVYG